MTRDDLVTQHLDQLPYPPDPVQEEALFALGGVVLLAGGDAVVRSGRRNGNRASGCVA
jgi:hypothetical protein